MCDPSAGIPVCHLHSSQWTGFPWSGIQFPLEGRRPFSGSRLLLPPWISHLVSSTSLWVHPQGFLSCTSPFLLCQMPSGIPPGSSLFSGHSVTHTHAGCICCFPLAANPSLLMLLAGLIPVPPPPCFISACWVGHGGNSGEVILPDHDGYMCMCACICCVSCMPGAVAKAISTMS